MSQHFLLWMTPVFFGTTLYEAQARCFHGDATLCEARTIVDSKRHCNVWTTTRQKEMFKNQWRPWNFSGNKLARFSALRYPLRGYTPYAIWYYFVCRKATLKVVPCYRWEEVVLKKLEENEFLFNVSTWMIFYTIALSYSRYFIYILLKKNKVLSLHHVY